MGSEVRSGALACAFVLAMATPFASTGCGVSYPNCNGDNDCRSHHEVCVNRHCQQCRTTADCPAEHTCLRNRCVEGTNACENDADCPADQHCDNRHCVPRTECDQNHACPGGRPCESGHCASAAPSSDEDDTLRDNHGRLCEFEPIYFAFDTPQLDDRARHSLQAAADCLQREQTSRYVLIGRTDPRGTTEYNLALGERRARMAQNYLRSLGITAERIEVSSAGSEGATGTDEATWAHDRRMDFRPRQ
jgi:peptidoglycan-associated lipoprotein